MPPDMPPPQAQAAGSVWDTLTRVFTSQNAIFILGTLVVLAILFGIFAKLGVISVHRKGVKIGKNTALAERVVLRKQLEYIQRYCLALEPQLAKLFEKRHFTGEGAQVFYFKYLASLVSNEIERWILVNSISKGQTYVQSKQVELKAFLLSQVGNCPYNEANLDRKVSLWVREIVEHLSLIRHGAGGLE